MSKDRCGEAGERLWPEQGRHTAEAKENAYPDTTGKWLFAYENVGKHCRYDWHDAHEYGSETAVNVDFPPTDQRKRQCIAQQADHGKNCPGSSVTRESVAAEAKSRVQDGGGNTQARTGQCHWTYALHPNFDKDK